METRRLRTMRALIREYPLPIILILGFTVQFPFVLNNAFLSDESVYTYAAYAISKGLIPYKEIVLAHPPIGFAVLAPLVSFASGNLLAVRTIGLLLLLIL